MTDTAPTAEPEDLWNVTPERAGELLAQKTQQYNATEAGSAVKEPTPPTDADGKPIAPPVALLTPEERDAQRMAETQAWLEERGSPMRGTPLGDDLDRIEGRKPVSAETQRAVERKLASLRNDAEWVRKFFSGDARAVEQWHIATGLIAAGKNQRFQG
jgi:hypothetical protein